jgi:hypothetical protein
LAENGPEKGEPWAAALRRVISLRLRNVWGKEDVLRTQAVDCIADHAHEPRAWLMLDDVDRVDSEKLEWVFTTLQGWNCRLILASRLFCHDAASKCGVSAEYRLVPLSCQQVDQFVNGWFQDSRQDRGKSDLLRHDPTIRQLETNPLLLTLLCWYAEQHQVDSLITRGELIQWVLRDILARSRTGRSKAKPKYVDDWLRVLPKIPIQSRPRKVDCPQATIR